MAIYFKWTCIFNHKIENSTFLFLVFERMAKDTIIFYLKDYEWEKSIVINLVYLKDYRVIDDL